MCVLEGKAKGMVTLDVVLAQNANNLKTASVTVSQIRKNPRTFLFWGYPFGAAGRN